MSKFIVFLALLSFSIYIWLCALYSHERFTARNNRIEELENIGWSSDAAGHIADVELGFVPVDSIYLDYLND